jgi:V8-like Glu-specific endopeptidase
VKEEQVDYFPNQTTRCFRPHCKPNKNMLEHLSIANLQPIDSQELKFCQNDTRTKVSDPLDFPYSAIGFLSLKYG